jgi:hypothetical protein
LFWVSFRHLCRGFTEVFLILDDFQAVDSLRYSVLLSDKVVSVIILVSIKMDGFLCVGFKMHRAVDFMCHVEFRELYNKVLFLLLFLFTNTRSDFFKYLQYSESSGVYL